ncbi:MAG: tRNA uridine-5-carboxymethylaminomethyl(34) synthesis GTPase MnmE [Simkaniaceae bacterium]|nr:tRNA uridine-5-carboxymethylaminomethyl(34) synthesis GTPase MnmE [Simkaniaceae bacterium]
MGFANSIEELTQTIAAIATPPGEGGIAVIRISGQHALDVASKLFSKDVMQLPSHTVHFGHVLTKEGERLDDVLLIVMKAPRSFTGEDTVEIHCHGGLIISRKVLARVLECGAAPAGPGEFSKKAFLNGKIDLSQAEAIQELISAKNDLACSAAENQLQGALSKRIQSLQKTLTHIAAIIEAWVDYPEEGLEFASEEEILDQLTTIQHHLNALIKGFRDGRILNHGLNLCILGSPNVGKSSLMNTLLGYDRAIVTDIAGTTRDVLQETLKLGDLHFNLIDTAGIRETEEIIEQEGIRRSKKAAMQADLILTLFDATRAPTQEEIDLIASLPANKTLLVWNKMDLPHASPLEIAPLFAVHISAKAQMGIDQLKQAIESILWQGEMPSKDHIFLTQERHYTTLCECRASLDRVIDGLRSGLSAEFISFDLRDLLKRLGTIIGTDVTEDILNEIFSKFCVGK